MQLSRRVLEPRSHHGRDPAGSAARRMAPHHPAPLLTRNGVSTLERNFVLGGFPDLWEHCNWKTALGWFRDDLARFGTEARA